MVKLAWLPLGAIVEVFLILIASCFTNYKIVIKELLIIIFVLRWMRIKFIFFLFIPGRNLIRWKDPSSFLLISVVLIFCSSLYFTIWSFGEILDVDVSDLYLYKFLYFHNIFWVILLSKEDCTLSSWKSYLFYAKCRFWGWRWIFHSGDNSKAAALEKASKQWLLQEK